MNSAKLNSSTSGVQQRAVLACILVSISCLLWLLAYRVFDTISQKDAWFAYPHTRVLCSAAAVLSFMSAAIIFWFHLLPGRPIAGLLIGIITATMILPVEDSSLRTRRERVAKNRFYHFSETTIQYIAFAVPVIIGCVIASSRSHAQISEQADARERR